GGDRLERAAAARIREEARPRPPGELGWRRRAPENAHRREKSGMSPRARHRLALPDAPREVPDRSPARLREASPASVPPQPARRPPGGAPWYNQAQAARSSSSRARDRGLRGGGGGARSALRGPRRRALPRGARPRERRSARRGRGRVASDRAPAKRDGMARSRG